MDLVFGWRSAMLLSATLVLLPLAAALASSLRNRLANRTLAALTIVLVGVFTPWLIGFVGFYDRWRWLTFLPVAVPLLVPTLLRFYVHALVTDTLPPRWRVMLVPGLVEFAFQAVSFCLPMPLKDRWAGIAFSFVAPIFSLALIGSFAVHMAASVRLLRRYRAALVNVVGDDARFAARWLSAALAAFAILWSIWAAVLIWDWFDPLGYTGLMWLYLMIASAALFLAIEGWRHAQAPFPTLSTLECVPAIHARGPARDWARQGVEWAEQTRLAGWAGDPDIDVATLARLLGTNTAYLSRALNEGLGQNFSTFINGLRCRAVMDRLEANDGRDVLTLALEAGFASKASFNRAFRAATGMTPSQYRTHVAEAKIEGALPEMRRPDAGLLPISGA